MGKFYFYSIENRTLFIAKDKPTGIVFRKTMASLFEYLLRNAQGSVACDDEIMANLWEANSLKSSNQRLWQVMGNLKAALQYVGLDTSFIMRVNSCGYFIKDEVILSLYIQKKTF